MAFKLISKNNRKTPEIDCFVIKKAYIRFPIKLRKGKKSFFRYADVYKDKYKLGFNFSDNSLTGYSILKNTIAISNRKIKEICKEGIYNYYKDGDLYIIDLKKPIKLSDALEKEGEQ